MSDQKLCPTCGTEYPLSERFCPRDGTALRSANAQADLLGSIIADRYHILKKLGEGGMGTVYLAEHVKMGRKSALKVMNPGMNTDPDAIARFNREASNASRLSHPNICGIYDFGETTDGMIYLAMEFIEGSSLTSLIETAGSLPAPRVASLIHQTADALQVAHDAGIVHRDLKPDNIMVARNRDGSDLVKVVDFGIAKASSSDAQKVTKTGLVVGTPEYMSPEQLAGDKLDGRSDIYSLALVAFNALTGTLPFPGETAQEAMIMRLTDQPKTLAEVKPEVPWPAALQAAMDKALQRDAAERYASAALFGREFAAAIADMPMVAAAEAGTMVMGAKGAGATTPLPATRVSRNSAATVAMNAAKTPKPAAAATARPAAAKRSAMPMVLGGVGGVAVVAAVLFQMGLIGGGSGTATPPAGPDSSQQASDTSGRALAANGSANGTAPAKTGTEGGGNPTNGGAPGGRETKSGTGGPAGGAPGTTPQSGGSTGSETPSVMTRLEEWLAALNAEGVTKTTARRILGDAEALQASLAGVQLTEARFIILVANTILEDQEGTCRAARQVRPLLTHPDRIGLVETVLANCS